ncbi:MAG: PQQ-binding-like beta-propeller repeat protein, partial [Marinomonas sp.]
MTKRGWKPAAILAAGIAASLTLTSCNAAGGSGDRVGAEQLLAAGDDTANWISYGRTYSEQRFSPLDKVNAENVSDLGLEWFADMDTARGQEATPLVIDGNIYLTTAWSKVKAYNGKTGEVLWEYDPEVPGETAVKACCDTVNRGLATWGDRLYLGTLDGRLIALDRDTGNVEWTKVTVDQDQSYTVTGAPRIVDGKVIIGNGGAEFGVRGYIAAYDADDGDEL